MGFHIALVSYPDSSLIFYAGNVSNPPPPNRVGHPT